MQAYKLAQNVDWKSSRVLPFFVQIASDSISTYVVCHEIRATNASFYRLFQLRFSRLFVGGQARFNVGVSGALNRLEWVERVLLGVRSLLRLHQGILRTLLAPLTLPLHLLRWVNGPGCHKKTSWKGKRHWQWRGATVVRKGPFLFALSRQICGYLYRMLMFIARYKEYRIVCRSFFARGIILEFK